MRALLATQGLAIVPAADVPTEEERAVLEAWSERHISDECLRFIERNGSGPVCQCARAELENRSARRAAKGGKP